MAVQKYKFRDCGQTLGGIDLKFCGMLEEAQAHLANTTLLPAIKYYRHNTRHNLWQISIFFLQKKKKNKKKQVQTPFWLLIVNPTQ